MEMAEGCCVGDAVAECVGECDAVVEDLIEERGVIEVIEKIVKHQSKIKRLLKALKKMCCEKSSDSE
jgi:hypothetical protein